ncbi:MAG TPA: Gfo/Idh/MocA family oxidoreductase [Gaiellaceae bacterium]|nr:Gfo/Idh/MocA family oxidoreductase [Gaiellaceae bacterium]
MSTHVNGRPARPLRVAVVGLGYWGPNLVRNLHEVPEVEVAAICDLRDDAVAKVGRRFPAVRQTSSYEDVLADHSVDAVVIATAVGTHADLVRDALQAGKHVFVEKPIAPSLAEAEELHDLAIRRGLALMVGHTFLYSPPVNAVRELIRSGAVGDVYFVSMSRVNLGIHQRDVSVLWDLGPHDFSILRYWLDETPTHVSAVCRGCVFPANPDVAFVNLEFPSGVIGHVELSWLAPSKLRRTTVVGSDRMVVYDDTSLEPVRIFDAGVQLDDPTSFGSYHLSYRTGDIVSPRIEVAEPLYLEMQSFRDSIRTGVPSVSSSALAVEVVRMIEAVDRSFAAGGERVAVEAPPLALVG